MEWVQTTGKTVEEAKEAALDQLGIAEDDAEFEVLEEPQKGLFGRTRGEARVRARVRPTAARPKVERRGRSSSKRGGGSGRRPSGGAREQSAEPTSSDDTTEVSGEPQQRSNRGRGRGGNERRSAESGASTEEKESTVQDATVEDQAAIIKEFLEGLLDAFDLDAEIGESRVDDDTIELAVTGDELGILVGPKGATLQAIHELSRTVVQRRATGTHHGRVRIDIAGYRQKRQEALERFARQVAADVASSGVAKALEPMHPADRKIVHDTVNEIDGVQTTSEGEEPRRRVVISPA